MSDADRLKREKPKRTDPIRDWTAGTRSPRSADDPANSEKGGQADHGDAGGDSAERSDGIGGVVRKGVELGYRVVEEQIRQGQRVAEEFSQRSYGPPAMSSDFREATERLMGYYQDVGMLWLDLVRAFLGSGGQMGSVLGWPFPFPRDDRPPQRDRPQPYDRDTRRESAAATRETTGGSSRGANPGNQVVVEIASLHPVQASLDLRPEADLQHLATTELSALDRENRPLTGVTFEPGADGAATMLRIRVPNDFPAGTYFGVVVDRRTNLPVGTLNVQVVA